MKWACSISSERVKRLWVGCTIFSSIIICRYGKSTVFRFTKESFSGVSGGRKNGVQRVAAKESLAKGGVPTV